MDTPIAEPSFDGKRWSNAEADRVELADADPRWPQRFSEESHRIAEALQLPGLVIEHIGSTAVPGLKSKPIIDILLLPPPTSHAIKDSSMQACPLWVIDERAIASDV
jgi:GrpB-like predicted nucleotidyltransferase (UPF0157 family)